MGGYLRCHVPNKLLCINAIDDCIFAALFVDGLMSYILVNVRKREERGKLTNEKNHRRSNKTFWNWLNGAKLSLPSLLLVLIQPINFGTTKELKGSSVLAGRGLVEDIFAWHD